MYSFEFDENKSQTNKIKHGIDFFEAQTLWQDADRLEIPARTEGEPRLIVLGKIGVKLWAAVITHRGSKIRIISVRRARQREVDLYENRGL